MNLNNVTGTTIALSLVLAGVAILSGCGQNKMDCTGKSCAGVKNDTAEAIAEASAKTRVGVMNYEQLLTHYVKVTGLDRPASNSVSAQTIASRRNEFVNAYRPLSDALPVSNKVSELNSANNMANLKVSFEACDSGIELDLAFPPAERRLTAGLAMTGLAELASPAAKEALIVRMIDQLWLTGVDWVPPTPQALEVLVPLFDELARGLPTNNANAEKAVLKSICSALIASAPGMML